LPPPSAAPSNRFDWKRAGKIIFWLLAFAPVGLWMLWQDPVLTRSQKSRLLIYGALGLVAFAVFLGYLEIHTLQKTLKDAGVE